MKAGGRGGKERNDKPAADLAPIARCICEAASQPEIPPQQELKWISCQHFSPGVHIMAVVCVCMCVRVSE